VQTKKIILIGAVGTAVNIIEQIIDAKNNYGLPYNFEGILIDSFEKGSLIAGVPVAGALKDISVFLDKKEIHFLFALYKPEELKARYELLKSLKIPVSRFINFIHPLSYVAKSVVLGNGNIILSNSTVQSNVLIGNFNIINSNVTIEHETQLGNGNFLAAGAVIGSNVIIGNHCFIGLNSAVRENVVLGDNVFTGMQSAVLNNYDNVIIAGIPARPIKK
jgi:sugar O-acyltransferase (sialic acid O-acetyltransferase NeuD family)